MVVGAYVPTKSNFLLRVSYGQCLFCIDGYPLDGISIVLVYPRRFDETWLAGCNQLVVVHAKRRHKDPSRFINFLEFSDA